MLNTNKMDCHSCDIVLQQKRNVCKIESYTLYMVTNIVGKPSATSQPTRPTPVFHPFWVDKWVVSWNWMCAAMYRWHLLVTTMDVTTGQAKSNDSLPKGLWH